MGCLIELLFLPIKLFFEYIFLLDGALIGYLASTVAKGWWPDMHEAFLWVIGIAVGFLFIVLMHMFKILFWVFALAFSAFWGGIIRMLAISELKADETWSWVAFGIGVVLSLILHWTSREAGVSD